MHTESEYCNIVTIKYYPHVILCNVMKTSSYDLSILALLHFRQDFLQWSAILKFSKWDQYLDRCHRGEFYGEIYISALAKWIFIQKHVVILELLSWTKKGQCSQAEIMKCNGIYYYYCPQHLLNEENIHSFYKKKQQIKDNRIFIDVWIVIS